MIEHLAALPTYAAYKDSGMEWLGEIPAPWGIEKGKWLFVKADRSINDDDDVITCFRDGQVTLRKNRRLEGFTHAIQEHGYQGIRKGDLVIHAMDAFAGAIGVSDSDGKSSPVYSACIPRIRNTVNVYYYAYFLRSLALSGFIESLAKGIRERSTDFRFKDFSALSLSFPPLNEQTAIAAFLDRKTAQIDQAVAIKEQQIALLKERKQILIQNAVTRGLDPNVPVRDSGVEWIGQIPAHWEAVKTKLLSEFILDGTHGSFSRVDDGYRLLSVRNIVNDEFIFREDDSRVSFRHFKEISNKFLIREGDIQLAIVGATLGKVALTKRLDEKIVTQRSLCTIRAKRTRCLNSFICYFMRSNSFQSYLWNSAGFSAQPGVYLGTIQNSYISLPDIQEQTAIVTHIETQSAKIDQAIAIQQQQIDKLKEYKATLINSAVTGKIKVTELGECKDVG